MITEYLSCSVVALEGQIDNNSYFWPPALPSPIKHTSTIATLTSGECTDPKRSTHILNNASIFHNNNTADSRQPFFYLKVTSHLSLSLTLCFFDSNHIAKFLCHTICANFNIHSTLTLNLISSCRTQLQTRPFPH